MPMPETTVHKDNRVVFGKDNVRFTGERSDVLSVSESLGKKELSH